MVRSDLTSEAVWRPKQPQKIYLKKSGCYLNLLSTSFRRLSQSSSVNEFQEGSVIELKSQISKETAPPMAAAGLLGPALVLLSDAICCSIRGVSIGQIGGGRCGISSKSHCSSQASWLCGARHCNNLTLARL